MFGRDIVSYRKSRYTTKCHNIFSMPLFLVVGLDIVFYNFIYTYGGLTSQLLWKCYNILLCM